MKKLIAVVLTVTVFAGLAQAAAVEGFLTSWSAAQKAAKAQNKPVFLHFTTTWCGWCRKIENDIYKKDEGKEAMKDFVPASLDCTRRGRKGDALKAATANNKLMGKYGGGGYPFLAIVTHDGVVLNTFSGYKPMPAFKAELAKAKKVFKEYGEFQKYAATADKNSYEYNLRAMKTYSALSAWDQALAAAEKIKKLDPQNKKGDRAAANLAILSGASAKGDEAGLKAAVGEIRKLDAENAKGLLEKALIEQAEMHFRLARTRDQAVRKKNLQANLQVLTDLTGAGKKLKDPQNAYFLLARAHSVLGDNAKTVSALEKALQADPKSKIAPRLRQLIKRFKGGG